MSLLLNQPLKLLCFRRPVLVRSLGSSPLLSNNGFSTSLQQNHDCILICADRWGGGRGRVFSRRHEHGLSGSHILSVEEYERETNDMKLREELRKELGTTGIGSSNRWLPILKDGVLSLQDMNLIDPDTDPKRISLPPLVTLPHCQTQYITNVAMSCASPEEEDCVVAVKFLGPQLSFCRPAQSNSEWINIRMECRYFFSSPVMFSKKHDTFRMASSGGHLIGSWDLHKHSKNPKYQRMTFQNLPNLTETQQDLLNSCYTNELLAESRTTGQIFMVKLYKKSSMIMDDIPITKTEVLMVFKLDDKDLVWLDNAVYTQDIEDQSIFLTKSEALCDQLSSSSCLFKPNHVTILDLDEEYRSVNLAGQEWLR